MPRLSQWLVRTALIYLLLGFSVGALLLAHKGIPWQPLLWRWLPAHIEFLLMGWVVQLTMGVAFWILPRFWQRARRPWEGFVYLAWLLLNLGIWLVVAGTPEDLWPKLRNFWIELGFVLNVDAPQIGVLETDWAEDRAKIEQSVALACRKRGMPQERLDQLVSGIQRQIGEKIGVEGISGSGVW